MLVLSLVFVVLALCAVEAFLTTEAGWQEQLLTLDFGCSMLRPALDTTPHIARV